MNLQELLAAALKRAGELKAKSVDTWTDDEVAEAIRLKSEVDDLRAKIAQRQAGMDALKAFEGAQPGDSGQRASDTDEVDTRALSLGEAFVKSAPMREHRKAHPLGVSGSPVSLKASGFNRFGVVRKADAPVQDSTAVGAPATTPTRLPGITDLTYRKPTTLLDLISTGTTATPFVQYRALIAIANNAAVVPEKGTKPLSGLTFALRDAAAFTFADGVKITNQELADDGILSSLINTTLIKNLALLVEDKVLNGSGTAEPRGILNTTGVLQQAFSTDLVTSARKALTLLRNTASANVEAFVMNPVDIEAIDLLKDGTQRFYGNGPFGIGPNTLWGVQIVASSKITAGTALAGEFSGIQLLDREGLSIEAFNQNEDDARRNLTYIRAEQRSMLLFREPAKVAVVALKAA